MSMEQFWDSSGSLSKTVNIEYATETVDATSDKIKGDYESLED